MRDRRILIADTWRAEGDVGRAPALLEAEMAGPEAGAAMDDADGIGMTARMAAWRIPAAAKDPRAARQLEQAWAELQRLASRVRDPAVKERMLAAGPLHRKIAAAWAVRAAERARSAS